MIGANSGVSFNIILKSRYPTASWIPIIKCVSIKHSCYQSTWYIPNVLHHCSKCNRVLIEEIHPIDTSGGAAPRRRRTATPSSCHRRPMCTKELTQRAPTQRALTQHAPTQHAPTQHATKTYQTTEHETQQHNNLLRQHPTNTPVFFSSSRDVDLEQMTAICTGIYQRVIYGFSKFYTAPI